MRKNPAEIEILRAGGKRLAEILRELARAVRPGITTRELDQLAQAKIAALGDTPAFLNYQPAGAEHPYPAALCVSVNDEVVHGLPGPRELKDGDLVSLDLGLKHRELFTDAAITVAVGEITREAARVLAGTKRALKAAIAAVQAGAHLGDIGAAVEAVAMAEKLGLVRELGGHGVGRAVHESPLIPNYGVRGTGPKLMTGMVLAIEPMLTTGRDEVRLGKDGFTYETCDGSLSAHFEETIVVTVTGAEVLTPLNGLLD